MGKRKKNNKKNEGLLTFYINPADIVMIATGEEKNGLPVVTEVRDVTEDWLEMLHELSLRMGSIKDGKIPDDFIPYAMFETGCFARFILELYKPRFIALPAKEDIEDIMYGDTEDVSTFMFLLNSFSETLHEALMEKANEMKIHVLIVPFTPDFITFAEKNDLSQEQTTALPAILMQEECKAFLKGKGPLPGKGTMISIDHIHDPEYKYDKSKDDYSGSDILTIHFSEKSFALVTDSSGDMIDYGFPATLLPEGPDLSEEEVDEIDSYIEEIIENYPHTDILFIEPELDSEEEPEETTLEHLEEMISYSVTSFILSAFERDMHVIIAPRYAREVLMKHVVENFNKEEHPCPYCNNKDLMLTEDGTCICNSSGKIATDRELIYLGILKDMIREFLEDNPILPGMLTVL